MQDFTVLPPVHIYALPFPEPLPLVFEKSFRHLTPDTIEHFRKITFSREQIVVALSRAGAGGTLIAVENYLPSLFGLMNASLQVPPEIEFAKYIRVHWTSAVTLKHLKFHFTTDSFSYEVIMVLFLYALLVRDQARLFLEKSLISPEEFDKNSKEIARLLCFAAGVFDYIKSAVLPNYGKRPPLLTPEFSPELYSSLICMCLAEAQQVTVRKAVLSNTSSTVIAKLCLAISQNFADSSNFLSNVNNNSPEQFVSHWRAYLAYSTSLWNAMSLKHWAIKAKNEDQHGLAVATIEKGLKSMAEMQKKVDQSLEIFAKQFTVERNVIVNIHRLYANENDTIYFNKTPSPSEMKMEGLEPKMLMKALPFHPPPALEMYVQFEKGKECIMQ